MKLLPKTQKLRVDPMFLKIIHTPVNDKTILETVMLRREDEKDGVAPWLRTRLLRLRFWVRLRNLKMIQGLCNVKLTRESSMLGKVQENNNVEKC